MVGTGSKYQHVATCINVLFILLNDCTLEKYLETYFGSLGGRGVRLVSLVLKSDLSLPF